MMATLALAACATVRHEHLSPAPPAPPAAQIATLPPVARPDALHPDGANAEVSADARLLMIETALSMLAQPYLYGGETPGGFDCSGLVVYSAAAAGISLPRTAVQQSRIGVKIARSQLQAGDLIFMRLKRRELHVAIALDEGRFIHAPSRGGHVRIDSLGASPYAADFVTARRIIPVPALAVSSVINH